ncbi:MAG: MarR family transcriptional regulator [Gammaproteobacteria bacterium]|nr:MAG: MarR family transcriptional regulator [Gammaproteobacteria bacterium]
MIPETDTAVEATLVEVARRCAMFNLRKASRVVSRRYEQEMKASGLLPTQFSLLVAVRLMGPAPMTELAAALSMDRTTLSRNLRPLLREGCLSLDACGPDRRRRLIRLTPTGEERLRGALPCWQRAQESVEGVLGPGRLERLLADLAGLITGLDTPGRAGTPTTGSRSVEGTAPDNPSRGGRP